MNRVKVTIKTESGKLLCKVGTSIDVPNQDEYSDKELADMLRELANTFDSKPSIERLQLESDTYKEALEEIRKNPGWQDPEVGFMAGHIAAGALNFIKYFKGVKPIPPIRTVEDFHKSHQNWEAAQLCSDQHTDARERRRAHQEQIIEERRWAEARPYFDFDDEGDIIGLKQIYENGQ